MFGVPIGERHHEKTFVLTDHRNFVHGMDGMVEREWSLVDNVGRVRSCKMKNQVCRYSLSRSATECYLGHI